MGPTPKNRRNVKGLSTVVTTLIILVASVILAVSVGTFGSTLFQTETRTESLTVSNVHAWVNSTGAAVGMVVTNTGEVPASIRSITVRGTEVPLRNIYTWSASDAGVTVTSALNVTSAVLTASGSTLSVDVEGASRTFNQATGETLIGARGVTVIYIANPDITTADLGGSTSIVVTASKTVNVVNADIVSAG